MIQFLVVWSSWLVVLYSVVGRWRKNAVIHVQFFISWSFLLEIQCSVLRQRWRTYYLVQFIVSLRVYAGWWLMTIDPFIVQFKTNICVHWCWHFAFKSSISSWQEQIYNSPIPSVYLQLYLNSLQNTGNASLFIMHRYDRFQFNSSTSKFPMHSYRFKRSRRSHSQLRKLYARKIFQTY